MKALLWNDESERRHLWRNRMQTVLMLVGMGGLLAVCGWVVAGPDGIVWLVLGGGIALLLAPSLPPGLQMRMLGARPLAPWQAPQLYRMLEILAGRAGLDAVPQAHVIVSPIPNAFAMGNRHQAAIAVTDGLLGGLNSRELAGVLAHEISHIRNGDIRIMGLADLTSRMTRMMSWLGILLLVLSLPLLLSGQASAPLPLVLLLMASPSLSALLQLALSRTREFDADLDAARLTGDPLGLISALRKMEAPLLTFWGRVLLPRRRDDQPSLLRTHPSTEERVQRLASLTVPVDYPENSWL
ncbi:MAG: zinc metalloprotease HtpX [Magnetospirillum sp.]